MNATDYEMNTPLDLYATRFRQLCDPESWNPSEFCQNPEDSWSDRRYEMCQEALEQWSDTWKQIADCACCAIMCILAIVAISQGGGRNGHNISNSDFPLDTNADLRRMRNRIVNMDWDMDEFREHVRERRLTSLGTEYVVAGIVSLDVAKGYNTLVSLYNQRSTVSTVLLDQMWDDYYHNKFLPDLPSSPYTDSESDCDADDQPLPHLEEPDNHDKLD